VVVRVFEFVWIGLSSRGKTHLWLQIVVGRKGRVDLPAHARRGPCRHGVFVKMHRSGSTSNTFLMGGDPVFTALSITYRHTATHR
jgi:hypothetical protein